MAELFQRDKSTISRHIKIFLQKVNYSGIQLLQNLQQLFLIDELITHNIFYTAIMRAQNKLKIYWIPEVEHKVLTSIKPCDIKKDVGILRKYLLQ